MNDQEQRAADVLEGRTHFECPDYAPHPEGTDCIFGGFSCAYWMIADGCPHPHWEVHYVGADDHCPCGTHFPNADGPRVVEYDASSPDDD